ncbi:hypothetical protein HNR54_000443 [Methanothermobacter sp. DSM 3267]
MLAITSDDEQNTICSEEIKIVLIQKKTFSSEKRKGGISNPAP